VLTFSNFLEAFRARVSPDIARQRKLSRLNAKMSSGDPADQYQASQEKQQYLKDIQAKKTIALHRMLQKRKP